MNQPQPTPQSRPWRRSILGWMPPLAVGAAVVLLILTAGDAAGRLATIKVLVWPALVALAAWWLRDAIKAKIQTIRRMEYKDAAVECETSVMYVPAVQDALDQATEPPPSGPTDAETSATEDHRRKGVERLIQTAVQWGFMAASRGEGPPDLSIHWTEDGRAEILGAWTGDGMPVAFGREANRLLANIPPGSRLVVMDMLLTAARAAQQQR